MTTIDDEVLEGRGMDRAALYPLASAPHAYFAPSFSIAESMAMMFLRRPSAVRGSPVEPSSNTSPALKRLAII